MHTLVLILFTLLADKGHCTGIYDEDEGLTLQGRGHDTRSWCYEQDHCKESSPSSSWQQGHCKTGKRQSPIDITSFKAKRLAYADGTRSISPAEPLDFFEAHFNYVMKEFQLTNNGHSIVLNKFVSETGIAPTFKWKGTANTVYKLQQVHFHWGENDTIGSEHKIDGESFPAEMHLVHFRSDIGENGFPSFMDAALSGKPDALVVIGIFLELGENVATSFLEPVVSNLGQVPHKSDKVLVNSTLDLGQTLQNGHKAFHYMGSLTTPDCNEIVAWLLLVNPVKISANDLVALRGAVKEEKIPLLHNYRSAQDNKEPVYRLRVK